MKQQDTSRTTLTIIRQQGHERSEVEDILAVEEPLEIRLGYTDRLVGRRHKSISITMRTPGHDVELALGFLFSEGIITSADAISAVDERRPNSVGIELNADLELDLGRLERHFYTTSSCGVCGKTSLEALSMNGAQPIHENGMQISSAVLYQLGETLCRHQSLFRDTGGNHAAALFDQSGTISLVREDVGRHNAMDKLTGRLLLDNNLPLKNHGIMVSGRASFELMQKALMDSCPLLVAVGAPSSLAVELAQEYNMTLVGFLGRKGFNIYHGADTLTP